jgi:hypothetical protein
MRRAIRPARRAADVQGAFATVKEKYPGALRDLTIMPAILLLTAAGQPGWPCGASSKTRNRC